MTTLEHFDKAQAFQIEGQDIHGRLTRLGPALDDILSDHNYPPEVAEMLAQTLVLGVTLASTLKYKGLFTLQVQSDGPITLLLADMTTDGHLRGYARFDADLVDKAGRKKGAAVPRLLGNGHLAFSVDQGPDMERYQGIVALEGGTLAVCAQQYFSASEQLETVIFLGSKKDVDGHKAGAVMLQRLPLENTTDVDEADDDWHRSAVLLASLKLDELLDDTLPMEHVLYRLYHEDGVRVYEPKPIVCQCRCSLQKVKNTLKSFPRNEVIDEHGCAKVVCEFCTVSYEFAPLDLDQLYGS